MDKKLKLLEGDEIGTGLLVDNNGWTDNSQININEALNRLIKESEEGVGGKKFIEIPCILQKYGVKNKNGRVYPKSVLVREVNKFQKMIEMGCAPNEADHPDRTTIALENISHLITKMWWGEGDKSHILYGTIRLVVTEGYLKSGIASMIGDKIVELIRHGMRLGISSRGAGTLKMVNGYKEVQDDFELICFDLVSTPSTYGAYLYPELDEKSIMVKESVESKNETQTIKYKKKGSKISKIYESVFS